MAKEVTAMIKLHCPGGKATPAPPVGPALGQHGVNIGQFITQFNDRTKELNGMPVPVEITIFQDRSFEFVVKSPPASVLLKQAAGVAQGSGTPHSEVVGRVTLDQVREIAERKINDLNAADIEGAILIVKGTARSMGIAVGEEEEEEEEEEADPGESGA